MYPHSRELEHDAEEKEKCKASFGFCLRVTAKSRFNRVSAALSEQTLDIYRIAKHDFAHHHIMIMVIAPPIPCKSLRRCSEARWGFEIVKDILL